MRRLGIFPIVLLLAVGPAIQALCQRACEPARSAAAESCHPAPAGEETGVAAGTVHGCDHVPGAATVRSPTRPDGNAAALRAPQADVSGSRPLHTIRIPLRGSPPGSALPASSVLRI